MAVFNAPNLSVLEGYYLRENEQMEHMFLDTLPHFYESKQRMMSPLSVVFGAVYLSNCRGVGGV